MVHLRVNDFAVCEMSLCVCQILRQQSDHENWARSIWDDGVAGVAETEQESSSNVAQAHVPLTATAQVSVRVDFWLLLRAWLKIVTWVVGLKTLTHRHHHHHHRVVCPWMDDHDWPPCRRLAHGKHFSWDVPGSSPGKCGQVGWLKTRRIVWNRPWGAPTRLAGRLI